MIYVYVLIWFLVGVVIVTVASKNCDVTIGEVPLLFVLAIVWPAALFLIAYAWWDINSSRVIYRGKKKA